MYYIKELYQFFGELSLNNNRVWWAENRERYDALRQQWLDDLDRVISHMSLWEPGMASQTAQSCAYRIYRDTRFSTDKSPYKTYFSAAFSPWGRKTERAAWYLEIGLAPVHQSGAYGGMWCLDSATLKKLRHAIVDNIDEFTQIITAPDMVRLYPDWCSNMLKTIPKGWDRNHPQAEYLRMTNYGKFHPCSEEFFLDPTWPEQIAELFHALKPLIDFLNYSIDE